MMDNFNEIFSICVQGQIERKIESENLQLHGLINIDAINVDLINELYLLGPFGSQIPIPIIVVPNCRLVFSKIVGQTHIMCKFQRTGGNSLDAICFNASNNRLGEALLKKNIELHVAGQLIVDEWQGITKPKIKIVDLAPC